MKTEPNMRYGSVCSGIEAASVAWEPLGWRPVWFSEINEFCSNVLKNRWPTVPNLGSLTTLRKNDTFKKEGIDLLVGGTPCQEFSLAGHRNGLESEKGNLTLEYINCIKDKRPTWFVWENVPGVMSLDNGRTFGTILRKMVDLRYGIAYRVLDAKYFGGGQSRPRVFVVGHSSGDGTVPARVLCVGSTRNNLLARSDYAPGRIPTLTLRNAGAKNARGVAVVERTEQGYGPGRQGEKTEWKIRALSPKEEELRQGFSGDHTNIAGATDANRYQSIGNSMFVPCMRWIGERINAVKQGE
jgi:DNA (cytosine-5)-methyltransferase 1